MKTIKERKWKYLGALKNAIRRFLSDNPGSDELDVADAVRISLWYSSEVLDEMVEDGLIRIARNPKRDRPSKFTV